MTDLTALSADALSRASSVAFAAMRAAPKGAARNAAREDWKAISRESSRRAWNGQTTQQRADGVLYSLQQGEASWYEGGESNPTWVAVTAWVDGAMGAVEACEAAGISLAVR